MTSLNGEAVTPARVIKRCQSPTLFVLARRETRERTLPNSFYPGIRTSADTYPQDRNSREPSEPIQLLLWMKVQMHCIVCYVVLCLIAILVNYNSSWLALLVAEMAAAFSREVPSFGRCCGPLYLLQLQPHGAQTRPLSTLRHTAISLSNFLVGCC